MRKAIAAARKMDIWQIDKALELVGSEGKFAFVDTDGDFVLAKGLCAVCILSVAKQWKLSQRGKLSADVYKVI
mgnify:FL=1